MATINESLGMEVLRASAATVGRPKGVDGKKMSPRRAKMTSREVEHIKTKALKAGGPGSGRKPSGNAKKENQRATLYKDSMKEKGYRKHSQETNARGQEVWKHKTNGSLITFHPGGASHFNSNGQHIKDISFRNET